VSPAVRDYIVALAERTRQLEQVMLGASPRAALALMRAAQAFAAIQGRDFTTPDDVKKLASPVLAHRLTVRGAYGRSGQGEAAIADALRLTPVPTEKKPDYFS
jgi:MoxR-like ATPase